MSPQRAEQAFVCSGNFWLQHEGWSFTGRSVQYFGSFLLSFFLITKSFKSAAEGGGGGGGGGGRILRVMRPGVNYVPIELQERLNEAVTRQKKINTKKKIVFKSLSRLVLCMKWGGAKITAAHASNLQCNSNFIQLLFFFFFLEDFQPLPHRSASLCHPLARLVFRQRAVLDGVRIVSVGTAEGAGVCPEDGAQDPPVRCLQDVGAVNFLRRAVIPTEDAHLRLGFSSLSLFAPPVHGEQVEPGEASPVGLWISVRQLRITRKLLVRPEERDALLQVVDGDRRGARSRAAALQVSVAVPAVPNYAGANRGVILQAQGRFQGLGDRVGAAGRALVLGDKCRQAEVVVPKIKGVIIRRTRFQVAAL